jgi:hypothetical protein
VRRFGSLVAGLGGVALVLAPSACGPGFQAIYDGNTRFEHCYALEENSQAPMQEKASCWRDWSEHYTYGQTRDRIHYATARYVALSQAPNIPTDEALMMAAPGEAPRASTITAPAPTNAFAPPPRLLEAPAAPKEAEHPSEPAPSQAIIHAALPTPAPPESTCAETCANTWHGCESRCNAGAKPSSKGCADCTKTYRTCMRGCFK